MLKHYLKALLRKRHPVGFGATGTLEPVSPIFGLERGTPIDRYYIERFLGQHRDLIRGEVLEVGSRHYTEKFGGSAVGVSRVLAARGAPVQPGTLIGDLTEKATLPGAAIDCFICTQTFNFIFEVARAVEGAHHLLKPGGTLLATVAGISQISRYDMERWGDYWRFTTASLQRLFEPVFGDRVQVLSHGNLPASLAFLQGLSVEDLPDTQLLDTPDTGYQLLLTVVAHKEAT